jgi:signal transduction histidine kinase
MRTALAVVDPKNFHENSKPPPVLLSRVAVNDRTVAAYAGVLSSPQESGLGILELASTHDGLRVPPDHRRMDFDFAALSFVGPENVGFRHRLVGFDDDWMESGGTERERSAGYPRLPPGKYEFQVSACNSEGVWNEAGATLAFEVTPFFWQTWWFRGLVIFTFTAVIIAIVRYVSFRRLRAQLLLLEQQAALHKERARIAKDIHDDLGANLTQISFLGELAQQDRGVPKKAGEHIEKISNTARLAVKSLDEIVWAVNPRNDTLAHFIDYTGQYALDYLRVAGIRCRLDLPEQTPARELSTDVRHNLFLVVKEAINNTVKHAHATELKLQIGVMEDKLTISIEDNGCGFDQPPTDDGADGLRNMRQRLADIGGQCWINGRPGGGAKVLIEVPWTRIKNET